MWNERIYSLTRMELIKGHKNSHNQQQQQQTTIETLCHFILTHNGAMERTKKTCQMERKKDFSREQAENAHIHTTTLRLFHIYIK